MFAIEVFAFCVCFIIIIKLLFDNSPASDDSDLIHLTKRKTFGKTYAFQINYKIWMLRFLNFFYANINLYLYARNMEQKKLVHIHNITKQVFVPESDV